MIDRGFPADVFHNVDLTASRPARSVDIVAKHPECRPDPLAERYFYPGFNAAVFLLEFAFRQQPGRRVVATDSVLTSEGLVDYLYDQVAAPIQISILSAAGVGLEFVVSPAIAADIVTPLSRIRLGPCWPIELIGPGKYPALGSCPVEWESNHHSK